MKRTRSWSPRSLVVAFYRHLVRRRAGPAADAPASG